jgi:hypothetical protein
MRNDRTKEPRNLYERYVRDLVLVAHREDQDARSLFLQRWAEQLGDLTVHLSHLSDGMQETAFRDSLKARDGGWPQSLLGLRLALPRWFVHRVSDPHAAWREHGRHLPADLVLDPAQRATARPAVDLRIAL